MVHRQALNCPNNVSVLTYKIWNECAPTHSHTSTHIQWVPPSSLHRVFCPSIPTPAPIPTIPPYSFKLWGLFKTWPRGKGAGSSREGREEDKKNDTSPDHVGIKSSRINVGPSREVGSTLCHWSILIAATQNLGQPFWSNVCDNTLWWSHLGCWTCQESTWSSSVYRKTLDLPGECTLFITFPLMGQDGQFHLLGKCWTWDSVNIQTHINYRRVI